MENQKVDNTLNLAVDATLDEREKSLELDVGYHPADREWDIIIKYSGNIDNLRSETVRITLLLNQYAVVRIPQAELDAFANLPQIEYVEKPKSLFLLLCRTEQFPVSIRFRHRLLICMGRVFWLRVWIPELITAMGISAIRMYDANCQPLGSDGGRIAAGGYGEVTGTSFATPFVTGSAALMMEWGILQGNSPYLYGEALKANLRRGARRLPGIAKWPNPELGYGVLCLRESLPQT